MTLKKIWRKIKTLINPYEWQMRLLGLEYSKEPHSRRGLILIQIDGLSFPDLEQGMKRGHMPFLRNLIRREHYKLHPLYSGVPSNTPSFQGEFFWGETQCVPAFQFWERGINKIYTMYDKNSAEFIEKKLSMKGPGLIDGGSAYCDIFAGGAAESHVCASTADWINALKVWNPYSLLIGLLLTPYAMLRGILLCLTEAVLSFIDFLHGSFTGQDTMMELLFIFTRVFSSIFIREIATAHVRMDIHRGLPVIQVNFFGYDEQAHRRGPSSRFAYWSLSGIDAAARRIWLSAMRAHRRHYDVWIYSDHGQETVQPFSKLSGFHIREAVQKLYKDVYLKNGAVPAAALYKNRSWGDNVIGKRYPPVEKAEDESLPVVTTLGPIAQIYFPFELSDAEKKDFAARLMRDYPMLPLIAISLSDKTVGYQTYKGNFHLPENTKEILGDDHPYCEAVAEDLELLSHHPYAGDLILYDWSVGRQAISFSNENGAHAGPGPRETQAFALLPSDVPLNPEDRSWVRAIDLRKSALTVMGKIKKERRSHKSVSSGKRPHLRVLSYNVHSCVGGDGILSVERIAKVIAKSGADIVALQELDAGRRIQGADQAAVIAAELEMHFHFHPVCGIDTQCFGNAILSAYPMRIVRAEMLPALRKDSLLEPRGILWVEIDFHGKKIQVINTHLSIWGPELEIQMKYLLGPAVMGRLEIGQDFILCGDFNMTPDSKFYRQITSHLKEPKNLSGKKIPNTWTGQWPVRRLDYIFTKEAIKSHWVHLPRTRLERYASDHLPIAADFEF